MTWIITRSGKRLDPLNPDPALIDIFDIAEALSKESRFAGHCKGFYSVAQHSLIVSLNAPEHLKLMALLHDAPEAYIKDMPSPIKKILPDYRAIDKAIWSAIAQKFNLPLVLPPEIKQLDLRALATERRDLLESNNCNDCEWQCLEGIKPFIGTLEPNEVHHWYAWREAFLMEFIRLTRPGIERIH